MALTFEVQNEAGEWLPIVPMLPIKDDWRTRIAYHEELPGD